MKISERLREKFETAKHVCVLTGAGISAESGVPTFRGGGQAAVWKGMLYLGTRGGGVYAVGLG